MVGRATDAAEASPPLSRTRLLVIGTLLVLVAIVVGVLVGRATAPAATQTPEESSAEAGFARDMQVHHGQAIEMSLIIRERTDDPEIRLLALDIATGQTQQQGQMFAWLTMWGLPQTSSRPAMEWMSMPALNSDEQGGDHTGMDMTDGSSSDALGGAMPGMATPDDLQLLSSLSGVEAERLYLRLMMAHHQGGVELAESVLARSNDPQVRTLAQGMVQQQSKELDYMSELLAARS